MRSATPSADWESRLARAVLAGRERPVGVIDRDLGDGDRIRTVVENEQLNSVRAHVLTSEDPAETQRRLATAYAEFGWRAAA